MLDNQSWLRLVRGLIAATSDGSLRWSEKGNDDDSYIGIGLIGVSLTSALNGRGRAFTASNKGATYELSATNALGQAPYELSVWEYEGRKTVPLGTLRSSASVGLTNSYELNSRLEELFKSVQQSIEPSSSIVDRLLGDLGQSG